jgi:hypothetical protein
VQRERHIPESLLYLARRGVLLHPEIEETWQVVSR